MKRRVLPTNDTTEQLDLLWGVSAIARHIKTTKRKAQYLIANGFLPVTKVGPKTIVGRRSEIVRAFSAVKDVER